MKQQEWNQMTLEEKKHQLFLNQKKTLDLFLEKGAITQAQYDKSFGDLCEKMGISKEDAAHIFERFYKADKSRGINKRGTGIGLFLVKNIIKEHGEDIILTSK